MLHTSFRPHLAVTPLCFAIPSSLSDWEEDFHLQAVEHARHTDRIDGAAVDGYREMLKRLATESGIATPTAENLIRLDRKREGKRLSNADWASPTDPQAKVAKLKDGRTRLAYKPEHAVDLDTGAIVAAGIHLANQGDTTTLPARSRRPKPTWRRSMPPRPWRTRPS